MEEEDRSERAVGETVVAGRGRGGSGIRAYGEPFSLKREREEEEERSEDAVGEAAGSGGEEEKAGARNQSE